MAITQTDLDALDRAIADGRGARSMTFSDQSITFGSVDEMLKLRAFMQSQLDAATRSTRTRYAATSKGL